MRDVVSTWLKSQKQRILKSESKKIQRIYPTHIIKKFEDTGCEFPELIQE